MQDLQTVKVHAFHFHGSNPEDVRVATFKATREAIAALGGEPIVGTAEEVSRAELDAQGHFRRLATGWGDLGS